MPVVGIWLIWEKRGRVQRSQRWSAALDSARAGLYISQRQLNGTKSDCAQPNELEYVVLPPSSHVNSSQGSLRFHHIGTGKVLIIMGSDGRQLLSLRTDAASGRLANRKGHKQ